MDEMDSGMSSEKTKKNEIPGQLSIFNETEIKANTSVKKPITHDVKGYECVDRKTPGVKN